MGYFLFIDISKCRSWYFNFIIGWLFIITRLSTIKRGVDDGAYTSTHIALTYVCALSIDLLSHVAIIVLATIYYCTCAMSYNSKLAAITAAAGEAQLRLLYCATCPNTLASDWSDSTTFNWSLNVACRDCKSTWSVCRLCRKAVVRYTSRLQMSRHNSRYHRHKAIKSH